MLTTRTTVHLCSAAAAIVLAPMTLVAPSAHAGSYVIGNGGAIDIPDQSHAAGVIVGAQGVGMTGRIAHVDVSLQSVSHTFPDDLDIALQSPAGTVVMLASDACGGEDLVDVTLGFDDTAGAALPDGSPCTQGVYRPTDHDIGEDDPGFLVGTTQARLRAFKGENPNGVWQLLVSDDTALDTGSIASGFALGIITAPNTRLLKHPPHRTHKRKVVFKAGSDELDATFQCKLDRTSWKRCPERNVVRVGPGRHVYQVRAKGLAGYHDTTPAKWRFRVRR